MAKNKTTVQKMGALGEALLAAARLKPKAAQAERHQKATLEKHNATILKATANEPPMKQSKTPTGNSAKVPKVVARAMKVNPNLVMFAKGQAVQAEFNDGKWYDAFFVKLKGDHMTVDWADGSGRSKVFAVRTMPNSAGLDTVLSLAPMPDKAVPVDVAVPAAGSKPSKKGVSDWPLGDVATNLFSGVVADRGMHIGDRVSYKAAGKEAKAEGLSGVVVWGLIRECDGDVIYVQPDYRNFPGAVHPGMGAKVPMDKVIEWWPAPTLGAVVSEKKTRLPRSAKASEAVVAADSDVMMAADRPFWVVYEPSPMRGKSWKVAGTTNKALALRVAKARKAVAFIAAEAYPQIPVLGDGHVLPFYLGTGLSDTEYTRVGKALARQAFAVTKGQ